MPARRTNRILGRGSWSEAPGSRRSSARRPSAGAAAPATVIALVWAQLPRRRLLHRAPRLRRRPGGAAPAPVAGRLVARTGCWRSSSSSPDSSSSASSSPATCGTPPGGPARRRRARRRGGPSRRSSSLVNLSTGAAALRAAGPSRPRPTSRSRSPSWRSSAPTSRCAADVPADPRGRGRPGRDHDHRDLLHRATWTCCPWRALVPLAAVRLRCSAGSARGGCCCPLAVATWGLVHASGVHATVAGVLLGFTVPVMRCRAAAARTPAPGSPSTSSTASGPSPPASRCRSSRSSPRASRSAGSRAHRVPQRPDRARHRRRARRWASPSASSAPTWLTARFTRASLDDELSWIDVSGVALLGGIGFTVSLLIGELAFGPAAPRRPRQGRRPDRLPGRGPARRGLLRSRATAPTGASRWPRRSTATPTACPTSTSTAGNPATTADRAAPAPRRCHCARSPQRGSAAGRPTTIAARISGANVSGGLGVELRTRARPGPG